MYQTLSTTTHHMRIRSKIIIVVLSAAALLGIVSSVHSHPAPAPENIVWLWDGATPPAATTNVALVVEHLWLKNTTLLYRRRATSPVLAKGTRVTPVVHVEVDVLNPPPPPYQYREKIIDSVLNAAASSTSGWVQLDYEAPPSHQAFYKDLVHEIKQRLPSGMKLSVTTLAWWCSAGNRLDDLDADEVVPMFFKMGKDSAQIKRILRDNPQALNAACQGKSAGFALQERPEPEVIRRYSRTYWFDYQGWKGKAAWVPS
jgi:hypothetical protein